MSMQRIERPFVECGEKPESTGGKMWKTGRKKREDSGIFVYGVENYAGFNSKGLCKAESLDKLMNFYAKIFHLQKLKHFCNLSFFAKCTAEVSIIRKKGDRKKGKSELC